MNQVGSRVDQLIKLDSWLAPYREQLQARETVIVEQIARILDGKSVGEFSLGHLYFGLHRTATGWILREWAPHASAIYLQCDSNNWQDSLGYVFIPKPNGIWELALPFDKLKLNEHYKLHIYWRNGDGLRLPAYAQYVLQDKTTQLFSAVVLDDNDGYSWLHKSPKRPTVPLIYEAHIGMSSEKPEVASYRYFADHVLPRIKQLGYNVIQLMAIQEHPYYGSFGYQVSNFFAISSRFGNLNDLKYLIDQAHGSGIAVIMDVVHSHAVKNEAEGLGNLAGDQTQYFRPGLHPVWDSFMFDYGKPEVVHFLLSNLRYFLDEFHFDGFRFDGVTSMVYRSHGINKAFTSYNDYFTDDIDIDALAYLRLANVLIHQIDPDAITIAEEVSGLPGIATSPDQAGFGFDYRFNMGVADLWIKMLKDQSEEDWSVGKIYHELVSHRAEEKTINYAESHDQALVGDQTIIMRLLNSSIYDGMKKHDHSIVVDRGVALHKMIRLLTASTNQGGYLNFMGNEFGHPEWIDFPREGNGWSYKYARRQWNLVDNSMLKYDWLNQFDKAMIKLVSQIGANSIEHVAVDEAKKIIAYQRGKYIFAFNFSSQSYDAIKLYCDSGCYKVDLTSDDPKFGGYGNIDQSLEYTARQGSFAVYLPARTATVWCMLK